ncbi:Formyltransferase [Hypoxylon sp. FL0543]|nr:Formyltransferase [Hypoxylon sp. FL0543]
MQPLLRQAAARSPRWRPWRELSTLPAEAETQLLRPASPLLFGGATWRSPPAPSSLCRRCQARCYSKGSYERGEVMAEIKAAKTEKPSDPLRILFCGSDEFSCESLRALHKDMMRLRLIDSIDVVVRPGKRTGRGYKEIKHPPLRELAEELGLPIHELDTFTGWDMPNYINLIIAVSFGLFVPRRLLGKAKYGGLNVHPSLLPDLRGPAPLQHALLAGRSSTGVSLQTLDPERFDHGFVLARTEPLSIPEDCTYDGLVKRLAPVAAELLVSGLREGLHVPPLEEEEKRGMVSTGPPGTPLTHAPKITKEDAYVLPSHIPHLTRRFRVLGPLWFWSRNRGGARKRVIIEEMSDTRPAKMVDDGTPSPWLSMSSSADAEKLDDLRAAAGASGAGRGVPYLLPIEPYPGANTGAGANGDGENGVAKRPEATHLIVWVREGDGDACYLGPIRIETVKVEGDKAKPAARALKDFLVPVDGELVAGMGPSAQRI